ncbi:MAG TPA: translocation/assembly module TamB domain-containing protein, partial [Candidatus Saccharimonadia bacterium]|nr:translocation/assembly module TamB domain-containing protein [Candidatus Saccharimonadia bacterium]
QARYRVDRVPIALVVAIASPGAPLRTEGVLDGSGSFARSPEGAWRGSANLASAAGVVAYPDTEDRPLLRYTDVVLDADVAPGATRATARAKLEDGGTLAANVSIDGENLGGRIDGELRSLRFLELLTPEIVAPRGALEAHYVLGGTTRAPRFDGALELTAFRAELPTVGLKLRDGRATLRAQGSDRYVVDGQVRSGDGVLVIKGSGGVADDAPLELSITGERVLATNIPGVKIFASPALTITRVEDALQVRGKMTVPSGSINLRRLPGDGAAKVSRDVVVVDAGTTAEEESTLPLNVDVVLVLGEDVKVRGYGLDGEVEGQLRVRERPGRPSTGTGQIRISGKYRAYGQDLTIERGRLLFAQSPLDDPGLDIRAVRKLREVTPGLRIEGTAKAPVLTVFSEPAMEQGNALSYLVTGRPLRSLSGEDGDTVGMAARALGTATGDLLAKSIGAKMGVDDIGVAESDALGGAAFTVGKYLSPRLYLSYGVGVFDPGQVVTLRYQLTEKWELEANSGTVENRAGVNYRYERD